MLLYSLCTGLCTIALLSGQVAARPAAATTGLNSDESLPLRGPSIVEVRNAYRNVFPAKDFNRNVTTTWWQTDVLDGDASQNATSLKKALKDASFIVLNKDMYKLLGVKDHTVKKNVETIFEFPPGPSFAKRMVHDGTVYSPECNCIFMAELHPPKTGFSADAMPWVWRVNLNNTPPTTEKVYPSPQLTVPNGAYYHKGDIYWAQEGNYTVPGGITRMDPLTLKTEVVLNNFYGHRFNSPNDVVITRDGVAYFTDGYYGYDNFNDTLKPELANGLWRWDMNSNDLRMVSGAGGGPFTNPNGVALNFEEDKLYVTNRGNSSDNPAGGRTIYEFQLSQSNGMPVKGGDVFAYVDAGFPDGIKLDREGRVYGGITGGVTVFDFTRKHLGIIKIAEGDVAVNMQWKDNWLYIAGRDKIYRVELSAHGVQA
ncbi:Gluconolactonase [Fusarium oxysporum f. sp. cubense]|uniref:Gluconolactonase n=1 Tax=Fusarium oxysporum f. sp. cubense TaxID=61366 RepID=A0A559LRE1_FUSOC|nr:Gluconolactonase [Fusarium oxysporum f. sp. cubense]